MMKVLLLVCAAATPRIDCSESTARIVVQGPDAPNAVVCAMQSQAYFAQTSLHIGEREYLKITCSRTSIGKGNVG
jgi:hypothetical protein